MSDPRFDSGHLDFPRRQHYRFSRNCVLAARGLLTRAGEHARDIVGEPEDWPSLLPIRPDQVLHGTRFYLIDEQAQCAYALKMGLNTIGRFATNDIVLEDLSISRRHCVVVVHTRGSCELHDTASRNGTWLNGKWVRQPVRLTSGDRIKVHQRQLLFINERDWSAESADDDYPDTV
jgi:hypothetical protein